MSRLIQPVVSPRGRVIVLTGATLWLLAAMLLSAIPQGASADPREDPVMVSTTLARFEAVDGVDGLLTRPRLYTGPNGRLYIADRGGHRVIRLAEDGFRADVVFGREGAGPGELMYPRSVAVDSDGNVFVTDVQLQRLLKYAPDGTFIKSVTAPRVVSVLVDSEDRVIVRPGRGNALLERYTNDLEADTVLMEASPSHHPTPLGTLIANDRADRLILLDQSDLTVRVYDPELRPIHEWQLDPPQLRATVAKRLAASRARSDQGGDPMIDGVLSMALHVNQAHLAFTYFVIPPGSDKQLVRVAWYTLDGNLAFVEDRGEELIFANAILPDGVVVEATAEQIEFRVVHGANSAELENNN